MSEKITTLEISKNLPIRVISQKGMAKGRVVRFKIVRDEPGKDWQLFGETCDNGSTVKIIELQKDTEYLLIK